MSTAQSPTTMRSLLRLKRRADFLKVARLGRKWAAPGLVLQAWQRKDPAEQSLQGQIRVGFTTSRKVGNAVKRNRARRRLRAVAAQVLVARGADGHDFVLIGRARTLTRPFNGLISDLEKALKRLDAYRD